MQRKVKTHGNSIRVFRQPTAVLLYFGVYCQHTFNPFLLSRMYSLEVITPRTMNWGQSKGLPVINAPYLIIQIYILMLYMLTAIFVFCWIRKEECSYWLTNDLWQGALHEWNYIYSVYSYRALSVNCTVSFTVLSDTCFMIFHTFFYNSNGFWKYM